MDMERHLPIRNNNYYPRVLPTAIKSALDFAKGWGSLAAVHQYYVRSLANVICLSSLETVVFICAGKGNMP
jgi:hypothetical protein